MHIPAIHADQHTEPFLTGWLRPSPGSRPPTRTRTSATTSPSWTPSPQDGSPPNPACDIGIGPPGERAR